MKIDIIEFYPQVFDATKQILTGSLHIYIAEYDVDLRGLFVTRKGNSWHFSMPSRQTVDATGAPVRYPCFTFRSKERQKELMDAVRANGQKYIEGRLADTENPIIFPQQKKQPSKQEFPVARINNSTAAKQEGLIAVKPKVTSSIATKQWRDPPKRDFARRR